MNLKKWYEDMENKIDKLEDADIMRLYLVLLGYWMDIIENSFDRNKETQIKEIDSFIESLNDFKEEFK